LIKFARARARSFRCAIIGVSYLLRSQRNAWIHAVATILVLSAAWSLHLSHTEWCWMVAAIGIVWITEALNTSVELLCDVACTEFHPIIRRAKDVAAGGVLIAACAAAVIGACILGPHLLASPFSIR
jgi:diacylglycerol kinase (ATP)